MRPRVARAHHQRGSPHGGRAQTLPRWPAQHNCKASPAASHSAMEAVARKYFGGTLPRGVRELLSPNYRAGALALLRDVATEGAAAAGSLDAAVYGKSTPTARGNGFSAVLKRLEGTVSEQEEQWLLLCLVWISPGFASAIGVAPSLWDDYELCTCGAAKKGGDPINRVALHPIELYHRFVLRALR